MALSDTARSILAEASQHPLGLTAPPAILPAAARQAVLRSLLRQGLVAGYSAPVGHPGLGWRQQDGSMAAMQITEAGRQAIGGDEPPNAVDEAELGGLSHAEYDAVQEFAQRALDAGIDLSVDDADEPMVASGIIPANALTEPHSESPAAPIANLVDECGRGDKGAGAASLHGARSQSRLREAAHSVLAAWDTSERPGLASAINALRAALAPRRVVPGARGPRSPRQDTKQAAVLALLRRPEGASGPQLIEATGWAPHTVRGFLAGLGHKGMTVTVLERVRQVGPNKAGAKGSYSIYRIADAS